MKKLIYIFFLKKTKKNVSINKTERYIRGLDAHKETKSRTLTTRTHELTLTCSSCPAKKAQQINNTNYKKN